MNVGTMRDRVTIQRGTDTRDAYGQPITTWATVGTYYADLHHLSGREAVNALQIKAEATHKVTLRYVVPITPKDRLLFGTRVFNIVDVNDVDELHRTYELLCTEVVNPP